MKCIKILITIIILQISFNSYTQTIKRYESDFAVKAIIDKDESLNSGTIEDIIKLNVEIIFNTLKSTIEIKLSDHDARSYFFKDVKYNQTYFTEDGNKYVAYTANEDGVPYFISFNKDIIKVDNRMKFKTVAFHIKI